MSRDDVPILTDGLKICYDLSKEKSKSTFLLASMKLPTPTIVVDPHWVQCGSRSTAKKIQIFYIKNLIYLSIGLLKGRLSYRRSLQPSQKNIKHFKTLNSCTFFLFLFWLVFELLDPDPLFPCGARSSRPI